MPTDSAAGYSTRRYTDPTGTTEHLRRLWAAGGRDITVTYNDDVVRHRGYLTHPRTQL